VCHALSGKCNMLALMDCEGQYASRNGYGVIGPDGALQLSDVCERSVCCMCYQWILLAQIFDGQVFQPQTC
jgi:hypothetical protein